MAGENASTPGSDIPRQRADRPHVSYFGTNDLSLTATGTTDLGRVVGDPPDGNVNSTVAGVVVNATNSSFNFQIVHEGSNVFSSAQQPNTLNDEFFFPDAADKTHGGVTAALLQVDITSSAGSGTADFDVRVDHS